MRARLFCGQRGPVGQRICQCKMEPGRSRWHIWKISGRDQKWLQQRTNVESFQAECVHTVPDGWRIVLAQPDLSLLLQRDRGLGLMSLANAKAQGSGGSVKPATSAAGRWAVYAALQHSLNHAGGNIAHHRREPLTYFLGVAQRVQRRGRHAPGFARRYVTPRQRQRPKMAQAPPVTWRHPQEFSAPGFAVCTEADTIQRKTDNGFLQSMFSHHCRDMRMVVLHTDGGHA
ncbi:hypothetical protein GCM10027399_14200 [Curvibacter fontanus]